MAWHNFEEKKLYPLEDVVAVCKRHINSREVKNKKEKWLRLRIISECGHPLIKYSPKGKGGWSRSPMNPNNWQTKNSQPIHPMGVPSRRKKDIA